MIEQARAWLAAHQLGPGDRLGLALIDRPESVALIQAAWLSGVVLVPFNRRLDAQTLKEQAERAHLRAVVADSGHPLPGSAGFSLPAWATESDRGRLKPALPADDAEALVLFTSGTTGPAKAARIPRRAVQHAVTASCARLGLGPDDTWLGCLPLDHIAGIGNALRALHSGCRLVQHPRFDTDAILHALDHERITGLSVVPTQLHRLVAAGRPWPATLRTILVGGAPLEPPLRAACIALGVAPRQTYGLSECCAMVTCQEAGADDDGCGTALPGVELRVVEGRIAVRGPTVFLGYDDGTGGPDADGWFTTGDHGALDAAGRLTVLGRREDLILSGGENVYPAQVEARLRALPGVAEALVVGLPDAEWGQIVAAVLVGTPGPIDFISLPGPWRPRAWRWVDELPRTPLGKPDRRAVLADAATFIRA